MDAIHQELARLAKPINGTVGVCVQHVETGQRIEQHADSRFPMASVFKLPIAVRVLSLVDQGQLALDQLIEVHPSDLCPGSGIIQSLLFHPGLILSVENLLELALVISDNTANDVLLRAAGGPTAVTEFLRGKGIEDIRVDRLTKHMVVDKYGISGLAPGDEWSIERYRQLFDGLTEEQAQAAAARFAEDERDTATPAALVRLLVEVYDKGLLTSTSRDLLLELMARCQTGQEALKGMLPPGVEVAHKTGTLAQVVANDVGIITLPGDAGHLAIAVCVKSTQEPSVCQGVIAHVARAAYDYFLLR